MCADVNRWDGCNECGGGGAYATWGVAKIADVDQSRPIWPACPANGWATGAFRLNSRPNGAAVVPSMAVRPAGEGGFPWPQESHGPYTAFMDYSISSEVMPRGGAVPVEPGEGGAVPVAAPARTGPGSEGWYKSEFGCTVWPSFESISVQLPPDQWSMSSPAASRRNWNVANVIGPFFGPNATSAMAAHGEAAFKRQLYQSMISQVLFMKTEIEAWRSQNLWGSTFWMYNEIWPTGGWGSIEYGSPVPGQVVGGRWKPLHYVLRASTFADQACVCNTAGACFVTNDSPFAFAGKATVRVLNVVTGRSAPVVSRPLGMAAGPRVTEWFCATGQAPQWQQERPVPTQSSGRAPTDGDGDGVAGAGGSACAGAGACQSGHTLTPAAAAAVQAQAHAKKPWPPFATPPGHGTCTFHNNSQLYDPGSKFTRGPFGANTPQDCCNVCGSTDGCFGAVLFGQSCYTKTKVLPIVPQTPPPGVPLVACVYEGWNPSPPPPGPPAPPAPPAPQPPPPQLRCKAWNQTAAWRLAGCAVDGSDCVLDIRVQRQPPTSSSSSSSATSATSAGAAFAASGQSATGADGANGFDAAEARRSAAAALASWSTVPFVPPRAMRLPAAEVTATVARARSATQPDRVAIALAANATALYVVLTTRAQGRFSDNVLLVEGGHGAAPAMVDFISWAGPLDATALALLTTSLRVEHLAQNL